MASTFLGIEIARRGVAAHQLALQTTGHNISNADNPHYARQKVNLQAVHPLYDPALNRPQGPGMLGQGVEAGSIERIRDHFVDQRIQETEQSKSYWSSKQSYLNQIEIIYNEPSENSIRGSLDRFWESLQELSQYPEEISHREQVKERGSELTFRVRETYQRLQDLRLQADQEVNLTATKLNDIGRQLAQLNDRINKSTALGDRPNDLMDKRDQMLQELSQLADVQVSRENPNELLVFLGAEVFVQGNQHNAVNAIQGRSRDGMHDLYWSHNDSAVVLRGGKLQALLEVRDGTLMENIQKMNSFATNMMNSVNEVHRDGFGLGKETNINFFSVPDLARTPDGNYDLNMDGQNETSAVFAVTGRNSLAGDQPIGIEGVLTLAKDDGSDEFVNISYRADDTLNSVISKINLSDSNISAYLNHQDKLVLKAKISDANPETSFMIKHLEDSNQFLTGFAGVLQSNGPQGAFDYRRLDEINKLQSSTNEIQLTPSFNPAGSFSLSKEIQGNSGLIAAAMGKDSLGTGDPTQGNGSKDGSNALRIANAIRHGKNMVEGHSNPNEFYTALIARLGAESRGAQDMMENQEMVMQNLENLRQSVMGVNLDEEMADMVKFQHGYNAAARVLQTMNEMLDRIINRV